jgi:hypothetical protein
MAPDPASGASPAMRHRGRFWTARGGAGITLVEVLFATALLTTLTAMVVPSSLLPNGVPAQSKGPSSGQVEMVEIDGAKNPEMIPQWSAWELAFRALRGSSSLPTVLYQAEISKDEAELVTLEARKQSERDSDCQGQIQKLMPVLGIWKTEDINEKTRQIQLECRQKTLDARDRVLGRLRPEVQGALTQWVEGLKSGMKVSIAKRELAHYQKPQ